MNVPPTSLYLKFELQSSTLTTCSQLVQGLMMSMTNGFSIPLFSNRDTGSNQYCEILGLGTYNGGIKYLTFSKLAVEFVES